MENNGPVLLSDLIEDLRKELQTAAQRSSGQDLVFEIEKAELEAKVVVSNAGKGETGVRFWVVNAGGAYEHKGEQTHTVKLTLLPKSTATGQNTIVAGETTVRPS
jgi:hypothetical protein